MMTTTERTNIERLIEELYAAALELQVSPINLTGVPIPACIERLDAVMTYLRNAADPWAGQAVAMAADEF